MNSDVWVLMLNVLITMLCVAGIVLWVLRREYLPVIRELEREAENSERSSADRSQQRDS